MKKIYVFKVVSVMFSIVMTYSSGVFAQSGSGYVMTSQEFSSFQYPSNTITNIQNLTYYPLSIDYINDELIGAFADVTNGDFIGEIDPSTGNVTSLGLVNIPGYSINALAEDPTTGTVYALASQGFNSTSLFIFDTVNFTGTSVGVIGTDLYVAMDFDDMGNLYAINYADNGFYSIDKSTAVSSLIGFLGYPIGGAHVGLGYNPVSSTMYAGLYNGGNMNVCTVNLSTGVATALVSTTDTDVLTITFPDQPCDASFTSPSTVCSSEMEFDLSPTQIGGIWSGTGIIDSINGTFNPEIAGIGLHDVTYTLSCGNQVTQSIDVNGVDATTNTSSLTISSNATGATYQWLDCSNGYTPIAGETSQDFTATANGSYAVQVFSNGCVDTSECVVINSVSIEDVALGNFITIHPNPSSNGYFVLENTNDLNITEVIIRNTAGKVIFQKSVIEKEQIELDLSQSANGVFFLTVLSEVSTFNLKLLKQ